MFTTDLDSIYVSDKLPEPGTPEKIMCNGEQRGGLTYIPTSFRAVAYYGTAPSGTYFYMGVVGPPPATSPPNNLGSPSPPPSPGNPNAPCSAGGGSEPAPTTNCANPINAATGNSFQLERDFLAAPVTGLELARYYNSQDATNSGFGTGWHSTWHRALHQVSSGAVVVTRADGHADTFTLSAGVWSADPEVTSRLTALLNAAKTQVGWHVVTAEDVTETYALDGRLSAITSRAGLATRLTYDANRHLTTVIGPFGHTLKFVDDASGRVSKMTVPDGGIYTYAL
jgi:YD repeat-containing protein